MRPIFLLSDADQRVYIDGYNFFEPTTENIIQIARVTSLQNEGYQRNFTLEYVSDNLVYFDWPAEYFVPGDQFALEITFEGFIFYDSPKPLKASV